MVENDTILIQELHDSFVRQLQWYSELRDWARKLLSRLILSRGDMTLVVSGFDRKKKLMEQIAEERARMANPLSVWQERKKELEKTGAVAGIYDTLDKMEKVIREFLDAEEQLRAYLEKVIKKESGT